jgi:hypothetical protein
VLPAVVSVSVFCRYQICWIFGISVGIDPPLFCILPPFPPPFFQKGVELLKKGAVAPLLRKKGGTAPFFIPKCTYRIFLRYRYGKYREIPTEYRPKIPNRYTTLIIYCREIWIIFTNNRQKPTYWACQVKHTSVVDNNNMILDHQINIKPLCLLLSIIADMWRRREERRCLSQLDERPERGVTRGGDGAMRGGGAGRWEVAA